VNPVFSGYKLLPYLDASGQPVVRVQVDMKQACDWVVQKDGAGLRVAIGKGQVVTTAAPAAPVGAPERTPAHAVPTLPPSGPLLVSNVTFDKQPSGETFVDVSTSRSASYRVMTLSSPARLVVDIEDARNTSPQRDYSAGTALLKGVRIGQFRAKDPSVVRVVADLNGNPAFDVHATPAGVRIELRPRGGVKPASVATQAPSPQPKPEVSRTTEIAAVMPAPPAVSKASASRPASEVIDPKPAVAPPPQIENREAMKTDVQSTLPAVANSKQVVAAPLPPPSTSTPEALRAAHAAQALISIGEDSPMAAQGTLPASPEESKPSYTGEPISVNLKDIDLKDFFRLIHEISGLNIIVDPNVTGSVTMVLDSVPWDQALDIVLKNNRLGRVLEGNVLRIARVETLTSEQEGQTKLAAARMDAAPLVTLFRPLNYAKASEIAAILKTWAGGGALSRRGTVLVDARANTLIISDVQTQMPILVNILNKLDKKAKQVSIEARVVLATANFTRTLAASLLGGFANGHTTATGTTGSNTSSITIPVPTTAQPFPLTTATNATATGFGVASVVNVGANYFINAAISAAEERDQAKTISRPTIVTQNNVQGMVQQGVQVPIQTSINNTVTVQYENATLQMQVTPQVTDDNNIFLVINVNNASVGAALTGAGPSINTQQATTSVLVPDGGTVVFGGITVTSRSKAATYIPLLGNIPVLGHLFKTANNTAEDQELLFFVTPKILPG
jgi:type IV pilus assembly protein PilQ